MKIEPFLFLNLVGLVALFVQAGAVAPDENENCAYWASIGECDKNPGKCFVSVESTCSIIVTASKQSD